MPDSAMTPDEFRAALDTLGLSQAQAAPLLGYGAATRVSEVCVGRRTPSASVVLLLRAYLAGYRPDDWPIKMEECECKSQ